MSVSEAVENTPFDLKRRGEFQKALQAYARYYAEASEIGDSFIQGQCFEQIFDIMLLEYRRDNRIFESSSKLRETIGDDIAGLLTEMRTLDEGGAFESLLKKCWQTFSPLGRGKNPFSVDKNWLVHARKKRRDSHNEG